VLPVLAVLIGREALVNAATRLVEQGLLGQDADPVRVLQSHQDVSVAVLDDAPQLDRSQTGGQPQFPGRVSAGEARQSTRFARDSDLAAAVVGKPAYPDALAQVWPIPDFTARRVIGEGHAVHEYLVAAVLQMQEEAGREKVLRHHRPLDRAQ
jgi:hypothetical protein